MRSARAILVMCLVLALAGCGAEDGDGSVTVFAAASLTDAFGAIADAFEAENPGAAVTLNFAGSSSLREQILGGAPADVFASANPAVMRGLVDAGEVDTAQPFATNTLEIVVPAGNPGGVGSLDDFADESLLVGLCAEQVPCGELARRVLALSAVDASLDTNEPDVRALLTKIGAGELDAAIVYRTDVLAGGDDVQGIEIPEMQNAVATYPIGIVADSERRDDAAAFVEFVLGADGQAILLEYGFDRP